MFLFDKQVMGYNKFMNIRKTAFGDLTIVSEIYSFARDFMRKKGNPKQWNNGYPDEEIIISDIKKGVSYVIENNNEIFGVFTFIAGNDPTYEIIQGEWLNNKPYGTIHRIASSNKINGILNYCLDFCKLKIDNIRIDTHKDNLIMQHLLEKNGFIKCGIIVCDDGTPRIAYQKDFSINEKTDLFE